MKRMVSIQDISCVGRCSLTVALPILSAMGIETAILPTAVLSTHTMFSSAPEIRDLTDTIRPFSEHWKKEGITFDSIYTGYLASPLQIDLVKEFFEEFRTDTTQIVIDPAMADYGKLYVGFDDSFPEKMAELLPYGDLVLPNMTEAALMTGMPYHEPKDPDYTESYVREMLLALRDRGAACPVITGVSFEEGKLGAYGLADGTYFSHFEDWLPVSYHGTGDIFASACAGAFALGKSVSDSASLAVSYTEECIRRTMEDPERRTYGVNFEQALPWLCNHL